MAVTGPEHRVQMFAEGLRRDTLKTLETSVALLRDTRPGFDRVSISILDETDQPRRWAAVGTGPQTYDDLQHLLGEGPVHDGLQVAEVVSVGTPGLSQRWPHYGPRAARLGLHAQLAAPILDSTGNIMGVLNVYSCTVRQWSSAAVSAAEASAGQLALLMLTLHEVEIVRTELERRGVLAQAVGLLMAGHHLNQQAAETILRRRSVFAEQGMGHVAEDMVRGADEEGLALPGIGFC